MNLKDKIAIITGASTGIGEATAIEFAKQGAEVYLVGRNLNKLNALKKRIGENATVFQVDLANIDSINSFVNDVKDIGDSNPGINYVVNIAGVWHDDKRVFAGIDFEDFSQKDIINTINVGTLAPLVLCNALIPEMVNGGSIVNLSGTFENGSHGWLPYYVSKRSIEDFTIGLAEDNEVIDRKISVNCVSPSDTATEEYRKFFPEDAAGAQSPEDVARFIVDLSQKKVTGKIFVIKDGQVEENAFHQ